MNKTSNRKVAPRRPTVLIILDGVGISSSAKNLLLEAHTPNFDVLFSKHQHTLLNASGAAVGLPDGQMGNSEVGHLTIGAGDIIKQDLVLINENIENHAFFENEALIAALNRAASKNKPIHLLGLVSDGGIHSHINHLAALIRLCEEYRVVPVLHMITDGRDTSPQSALTFLEIIEPLLTDAGGYIATVMGRYYAMDRDNRWDRTERAWRAIVLAKGLKSDTADMAIKSAYEGKIHDEFIRPVILPRHKPLSDDDELIFFNFRKDRPRQITEAIGLRNFTRFDRGDNAIPKMTCFMPYDKSYDIPYAFEPQIPLTSLGEVVSHEGLEQFHCSETEKYAHVTYFINGGRTTPFTGETQLLIPSPDVATYDMKPEMSAKQVSDAVIHAISTKRYSLIVVNFANGDMVGHTANRQAILKAIETLDVQTRRIFNAAEKHDYSIVLTADHGNCETDIDPKSKSPHTQHTVNPVPLLISDKEKWRLATNGGLSNIAPTVLQLMGIEIPEEMGSSSLLLEAISDQKKDQKLDGAA